MAIQSDCAGHNGQWRDKQDTEYGNDNADNCQDQTKDATNLSIAWNFSNNDRGLWSCHYPILLYRGHSISLKVCILPIEAPFDNVTASGGRNPYSPAPRLGNRTLYIRRL